MLLEKEKEKCYWRMRALIPLPLASYAKRALFHRS